MSPEDVALQSGIVLYKHCSLLKTRITEPWEIHPKRGHVRTDGW
jgi:hypothetical protein